MNFRKFSAFFFALSILFSNYFITANCVNVNGNQNEIIFVPDEEIVIDSALISRLLSKEEKSNLCFVKPEESSENILSKELFPNDSPKPTDVRQGKLGLCYFFAVLSTVAEKNPTLIKNNLVDDGNGNVIIKFFNPHNGSPFYIKVQKTIPKLADEYKFLSNDCLWVHMYLKAFIASGFSGTGGCLRQGCPKNYKSAEAGFTDVAMRMITGKDSTIKNSLSIFVSNKNKLYDKFDSILSNGGYIFCDFTSHLNYIKLLCGNTLIGGLVRKHAYSIEKVYEDENNQKWVVIRNPWNWYIATYNEKGKRIKSIEENDGYSTLKWEDFLSECGRVVYSIDEPVKSRNILKRFMDYTDPVPYSIRLLQHMSISKIVSKLTDEVGVICKKDYKVIYEIDDNVDNKADNEVDSEVIAKVEVISERNLGGN